MGPLAFTVGLRLSVAISSWAYVFGSAQSHIVMTTLRSRPCGRAGVVGRQLAGRHPIGPVRASRLRASGRPDAKRLFIPPPACPA